MQEFFVIGDVHGKYGMLVDLLKKWDGKAQLVFLGDLIDRGEDSCSVLQLVKELQEKQGAWVLSGNHEYMFSAWINDPENRYEHYKRNGGDSTINSLLSRPLDHPVDGVKDAALIKEKQADLLAFIDGLKFHYETDNFIFVHAGVDLSLEDWRQTSDYDKVWIRAPFHEGKNKSGKTIFFGHTPTFYLFHEKPGYDQVWIKDGKVGMDGGAVYGGLLYGLELKAGQIEQIHAIPHDGVCLAEDD